MKAWLPTGWAAELRTQWAGNRRLRWGLLVIVGMLWIQGLLVARDVARGLREQTVTLREDIERMQPLARSKAWPGRADDARQQLGALRSMVWPENDRGLAEAAMQDWVRAVASKGGLVIRDLAVVRPAAAATAASAPLLPAGVQPVRLRLSVELKRLALLAFLSELARNEQVVVVERLVLRTASQPPSAEMDLRMLSAEKAQAK